MICSTPPSVSASNLQRGSSSSNKDDCWFSYFQEALYSNLPPTALNTAHPQHWAEAACVQMDRSGTSVWAALNYTQHPSPHASHERHVAAASLSPAAESQWDGELCDSAHFLLGWTQVRQVRNSTGSATVSHGDMVWSQQQSHKCEGQTWRVSSFESHERHFFSGFIICWKRAK